jgi:hypothetical protein
MSMASTDNEIIQDDTNTDSRHDEQVQSTEELRDLEPEKDVKGGLWPSVYSNNAYNKPI